MRDRLLASSLLWFLLLCWAAGVVVVVITLAGADAEHTSVPWWTVVVSLVLVLATGVPLHRWLRPAVAAVLFVHPDDAHELIAQVGRSVDHLGDTAGSVGDLPQRISERIAARLRLPFVAIVPAGEPVPVGEALRRVPLTFAGEAVGTLVAAPRPGEKSLSAADLALLSELATHIGITLHAVRVSADLQASRAALITAREEERRRLRRDLHDGLGPTLASLKLHLAAVQQLIPAEPERAAELLERLRREVRDTSAGVRGLVYGLRPPMLDELGLLEALRARAASLAGPAAPAVRVRVLTPRPDQREGEEEVVELAAATEVALYRIAAEALTNVERHAAATTCDVTLRVTADGVDLTVRDDGRGLPAPMIEGVGVAAMRERAEELGGTLSVTSGARGGTTVVAHLPRRGAGTP